MDKIVHIESRTIEVYPEQYFIEGRNKPKPGIQLNKHAVLTFNKMGVKDALLGTKKYSKIKRWGLG